ncbi:helix-turn-helix domain-containing protein [Plantactinospora solaniradicis]|uniref:Helix-turn-helix domain-containing protein n=1 Tax=Plantactinospora solaniradicis TaxID=1723736 RepID=A0ABW1KME1_9ACTN
MNLDVWIRALKAARAAAGVSQEQLATMIRWSASTIAGIETGRRRPTKEFAGAADEALQTGGLLAELLRIADQQRTPVWFAAWRGYEAEATRLCAFEPTVIPGLLQTEEYARAVLSAGGLHGPDDVAELLSARLERQELLSKEDPPEFLAIIDELALRRPVGGPAVLDAQLGHLIELAELPHVHLYALPANVGAHVGLGGGFVLADLPDDDRVAYLENVASGQLVDDPKITRYLRRVWDSLLGESLSESATLELLKALKVT